MCVCASRSATFGAGVLMQLCAVLQIIRQHSGHEYNVALVAKRASAHKQASRDASVDAAPRSAAVDGAAAVPGNATQPSPTPADSTPAASDSATATDTPAPSSSPVPSNSPVPSDSAAMTPTPSTTPVPSPCVMPRSPFGLPTSDAPTPAMELTARDGQRWSIDVPQFKQCLMSPLRLTPADPHKLLSTAADVSADAGITVTLVMWTNASRDGRPCSDAGSTDTCARMVRRVPLVVAPEGDSLIVRVVPDSSVDHYMFIVEVRASSRGDSHQPPLTLTFRA